MNWLERVRNVLRREPVAPEHRETLQRADELLARAEKLLRLRLASYSRVRQ